MKPIQIPIEERVEGIEKFLVFGILSIISFNAIIQNQTYIFGKYYTIFYLIVVFISYPISVYYFFRMTSFVSGCLGESTNRFLEKYKSKLRMPFFAILVLIGGSIMYLLGKDLKDIISSIVLVFIGVVIKYGLDHISNKNAITNDYNR